LDVQDGVAFSVDEDWPELRAGVADICARFPAAYWRELDRERGYPDGFVQALTEAGYLAALIPEAYGGSGLPIRTAAVILETIHACGASAAACHAQMYTMGTLLRHGSAAQKERWLPGIAKGELRLQAFGVTEPSAGTDTSRIKTRAVAQPDGGWRVSGQKIWTSRALQSDLMLLLARTRPLSEVSKPTDGMSVFLLDLRQLKGRGVTIRPIETMINHNTTEVFFDDAELPAEALIGKEGEGFRYILDGMNAERILIACESLGDSRWFLEHAVAYASEREVFGRPIGQNQGIQFPLAQAYAATEAAELMARKAAALYDAGRACGPEANMAKYLTGEAAWAAGEACMQTFGGFAFATEYDVERKWREARLYRTAPVSPNLILAYLAQKVLGLPRAY
jgi:acyl-CoA dehydrogenase